jgi:arylformamidase
MGMDEAAARRNSPACHLPTQATELVISYGALETAEFARQSHEFLNAWTARGLPGRFVEAPGKNHFDVVLELGQPGAPLYGAVVELMGL